MTTTTSGAAPQTMPQMTFNGACRAILADPKADAYAKTYARAGLGMTGEAARVQALYILCNLNHWRGDHTKPVRAFLKSFSKK